MLKSTKEVIDAYEKSSDFTNGGNGMEFKEVLEEEIEKRRDKDKKSKTPVLPLRQEDVIERYRTVAPMTKITDMKIF